MACVDVVVAKGGGNAGAVVVYSPCCSQEQTVKTITLVRAAKTRIEAIESRTVADREPG